MHLYLISFSVGALASSIWPELSLLTLPFILVMSSLQPRVFRGALAYGLGLIWVYFHWSVAVSQALPIDTPPSVWRGVITIHQAHDQGFRTLVEATSNEFEGVWRISCYQCEAEFRAGEKWEVSVKRKPIVSLGNPGGFDYRQWQTLKGITAKATLMKRPEPKRLRSPAPDSSGVILEQLRGQLDGARFPLMRSLLMGDANPVRADEKRVIRKAGLSHLFVVSGLHVGMASLVAALMVLMLLRPVRLLYVVNWGYGLSVGAGVLVAFAYAALSGFEVPAIRASLMLGFVGLIVLSWRKWDIVAVWLTTLICVLLLSPLAFHKMGAWLSFFIVLALVVFLQQPKGRFVSALRAQWVAFLVGGIILVCFKAPVVPVAIPINLVLIPLICMVWVPLGLLSFVGLIFGFGQPMAGLEFGLHYLLQGLADMQQLYGGLFSAMSSHQNNRWLLMLGFLLLLMPRALGVRVLAVGLIVGSQVAFPEKIREGELRVSVVDVGQGSAALVDTREHRLLVDTGMGFKEGVTMYEMAIEPYLRWIGGGGMNHLHLTHDDRDHSGGQHLVRAETVVTQSFCPSREWQWDGVRFWQFQSPSHTEGNNGSCLLKVSGKNGHAILFAGDVEEGAESALVEAFGSKLAAQILVAPHHGSRTSSSLVFLRAVNPEIVVISSGYQNAYGHPHPDVIGRYMAISAKVYSTASHGAISVRISPRQEHDIVSTYRPNLNNK